MSEDMTFLPKRDLLTLEKLDRVCSVFVERGVRKLRITGGEPLVRRDIMTLFRSLSAISSPGLWRSSPSPPTARSCPPRRGTRRLRRAPDQRVHGHPEPRKLPRITRWGDLDKVMAGIDAAQAAGLKVKINAVALKGVNEDEIVPMMEMGARPRHGPHAHRGDALGRDRDPPGRTSSCPSRWCGPASSTAIPWRIWRCARAGRRATSA
jgi:cyclic pyranopterin phosphate synthase